MIEMSQNVPKLCSSLFYRIDYFADIIALKSFSFFHIEISKNWLNIKIAFTISKW